MTRFSVLACAALVFAQTSKSPADPELQKITQMRAQSVAECNGFRERGGRAGASDDPARKWAEEFWKYREEHPGTPGAAQATGLAFAWMDHGQMYEVLIARADLLPLQDSLWASVIARVQDSSRRRGDYSSLFSRAQRLLDASTTPLIKASTHIALGKAYRDLGQTDKARQAFEAAAAEAPNAPAAADAERFLYEMSQLQVGQPAPRFEATTLDGKPFNSGDMRGKVVLLNLWASW